MGDYKTPGVYVEEKSLLPGSVAGVSTAIPAFIGYTEKAGVNGELVNKPTKVTTLKEYEDLFGTVADEIISVTVDGITNEISCAMPDLTQLMYYSMQMFFDNGGESCYIVSIETTTNSLTDYKKALATLEFEDEPTLIVLVDSTLMSDTEYPSLYQAALSMCNNMKDRFVILDVKEDSTKTVAENSLAFRNACGSEFLKYGAGYYPYLKTAIKYKYSDASVSVSSSIERITICGISITYTGNATTPKVKIVIDSSPSAAIAFNVTSGLLTITGVDSGTEVSTAAEIVTAYASFTGAGSADFQLAVVVGTTILVATTSDQALVADTLNLDDNAIKVQNTILYNRIKKQLATYTVTLPPSAAVAGIYASVDRNRGVWKAPANVSISSVISPSRKLTEGENDDLNIDPTSGKSINAIRSFTGKGILIWGARTLAGNDNEWRYVSVRRLFNYVEESIQKATAFSVFEPNEAMTWLKVRSMIESFLDSLWRQGALAGGKAEDAYFVQCGLGTTMTPTDILEGRLVIKIGLAAVRPAEFIILEFTHKLQKS